jgi:hypothetical protein
MKSAAIAGPRGWLDTWQSFTAPLHKQVSWRRQVMMAIEVDRDLSLWTRLTERRAIGD